MRFSFVSVRPLHDVVGMAFWCIFFTLSEFWAVASQDSFVRVRRFSSPGVLRQTDRKNNGTSKKSKEKDAQKIPILLDANQYLERQEKEENEERSRSILEYLG
jgi:carbon starvation protein CstA